MPVSRVAPDDRAKYNSGASPRCTRPVTAQPVAGRGPLIVALVAVAVVIAAAIARAEVPPAPIFLPVVAGGHPAAECAPSYPTVCLAPYPPDLNCADVLPLVNFAAVPPDEHHLDADHDGVACESPRYPPM